MSEPALVPLEHPPLEPVRSIVAALEQSGMPVALGGSAVLAWLGLTDRVRDWDVTVEGDPVEVARVLGRGGLEVDDRTSRDLPFASRARLTVDAEDHEIDVIVGFALRRGNEVVRVPVRVAGHWKGLPVAEPADWRLAYQLMGRFDRADALGAFLADPDRAGSD